MIAQGVLREMHFALPGATDDLYIRHQQVWSALSTQAKNGRDFVYRLSSPRIALVRSPALLRGTVVSDLPPARIELDLVASERVDRNKERAVVSARIEQWATALLLKHGLQPVDLIVHGHGMAVGQKAARRGDTGHVIRFGVASIEADVRIVDAEAARTAWRFGVGRGRRFGFGMLVPARSRTD